MEDAFKTIEKPSEGYFKDKGSKFIAYAFPVKNEEEIKELLAKIKKEHHSARHHCYAWRLGEEEILSRSNDDGETIFNRRKTHPGPVAKLRVTNHFWLLYAILEAFYLVPAD
jgi:predicted amidohydrolase